MAGFLETTPLEVKEFDGGMVDDIASAQANEYYQATNVFINQHKKMEVRWGSQLWDTTNPQPNGTNVVRALINYRQDTALFSCSGDKLHRWDGAAWTAVAGGSGGDAFGNITTDAKFSHSEHREQLFITNNEGFRPVKVAPFGGTYKAVTAGLPAVAEPDNYNSATVLASAITLANALLSEMEEHFLDIAGGNLHENNDTASMALITSLGASDLATLLELTGQLALGFKSHIDDMYSSNPDSHWYSLSEGRTGVFYGASSYHGRNFTLKRVTAPTTLVEAVEMLNDIYAKFYRHTAFQLMPHNNLASSSPIAGNLRVDTALSSGPQMNRTFAWFERTARTLGDKLNDHLADATAHSLAGGTSTLSAIDVINDEHKTDHTTQYSIAQMLQIWCADYDVHDQDAETNGTTHPNAEYSDHSLSGIDTSGIFERWAPVLATCKLPDGTLAEAVELYRNLAAAYNGHDYDKNPSGGAHNTNIGLYQVLEDVPDVGNYIYAFHYAYEYTINGVEYVDVGPPIFRILEDALPPNVEAHEITNIPALTNDSTTNYDLTNTKLYIYRTTRGGNTYYKIAEIACTATDYTDRTSDEELVAGEILYTDGGVVDYDPAPICKYLHIVNGVGYYGNITDGSESLPQRIRQSIKDSPYASPGDFYVDLPYDVQGISSARGIPVAWTKTGTYRLEGVLTETGEGSFEAVPIDETIGLVAPYSIIQIPEGLLFWGTDGIYFTDGYNLRRINSGWITRYRDNYISGDTRKALVTGAYDTLHRRVWWGASYLPTGQNRRGVVLDLAHGIRDNSVFTFAGETDTWATAFCWFNGQMLRAAALGYIYKHDPSYNRVDPTLSLVLTPANWGTTGLDISYTGPMFNFGTDAYRKWVSRVGLMFKPNSRDAFFGIVTQDERATSSTLGGVYYDSTTNRNYVEETRRMAVGGFRCFKKQLVLSTPSSAVVARSDDTGTAVVAGSVATIASGWGGQNPIGWSIYFEYDNYTTAFSISSYSGNNLTLASAPTAGTHKWIMKGQPKDQRWSLDGYTLHWAPLSGSLEDGSGENSGNA